MHECQNDNILDKNLNTCPLLPLSCFPPVKQRIDRKTISYSWYFDKWSVFVCPSLHFKIFFELWSKNKTSTADSLHEVSLKINHLAYSPRFYLIRKMFSCSKNIATLICYLSRTKHLTTHISKSSSSLKFLINSETTSFRWRIALLLNYFLCNSNKLLDDVLQTF